MSKAYPEAVCSLHDLVPNAGVAALVNGHQIALFYLPTETPCLYAIDNWDPVGKANVLSRGIVGDIQGELVVASPLYKQHFSLHTGRCLEKSASVQVWPVFVEGDTVLVSTQPMTERMSA